MAPEFHQLKDHIRDISDFPRLGVAFKDITPLLGDAVALATCVDALAEHFEGRGVDKVFGVEARGFIIAAPVATQLGAGFVPLRKPGKLPWKVETQEYTLEYGTESLEVHADAVNFGERVLIVDDVLATGGTAAAAATLAARLGAVTVGFGCIVELAFLGGRGKLPGLDVVSLLEYQ
jgi:adenine phosphoribosyltransferase